MIAAASNSLAQAAAMNQDMEAKGVVAVVEAKTGPDTALPRTEIYLISINNSPSNHRAPSMT